jgi:oligosaccharide repeat unit polymerase
MQHFGTQYPAYPIRLRNPAGVIPRTSRLPAITPAVWLSLGASVMIAIASYASSTFAVVITCLLALLILSVVRTVLLCMQGLKEGLFGPAVLSVSTLLIFWLGAAAMVVGRVPFATKRGEAVPWGQWPLDLVQTGILFVALFEALLFVGYSIRPRMELLSRWAAARVEKQTALVRALPFVFGSIADLTLLYRNHFDVVAVLRFLLAMRSTHESPFGTDLQNYANFFGFFGVAMIIDAAASMKSAWSTRLGYILAAIVFAFPILASGGRNLVLFVIMPALALSMLRNRGHIRPRVAIRWIVAGLCLFILLQLQFAYRDSGLISSNKAVSASNNAQLDTVGQFDALLFAVYLIPQHHPYFMEVAEVYFAFHWVPRSIWPTKPIMQSWWYYNGAYTRGVMVYNVTPSVIGQYYINWGIPGVLFSGLWLGLLTSATDAVLRRVDVNRSRAVAIAIGMFYAFIVCSFRFYSPIYFYYVVFGVLGMLSLTTSLPAPAAYPRPTRVPAASPIR